MSEYELMPASDGEPAAIYIHEDDEIAAETIAKDLASAFAKQGIETRCRVDLLADRWFVEYEDHPNNTTIIAEWAQAWRIHPQ